MAENKVTRKLTTILAADVEGYTRLMRADEEATLKTFGEYRDVIDIGGGTVVQFPRSWMSFGECRLNCIGVSPTIEVISGDAAFSLGERRGGE